MACSVEAFFQRGRVAMTVPYLLPDDMARHQYLGDGADMGVVSTVDIVANVSVFPIRGIIWASPEAVRDAKRVFPQVAD